MTTRKGTYICCCYNTIANFLYVSSKRMTASSMCHRYPFLQIFFPWHLLALPEAYNHMLALPTAPAQGYCILLPLLLCSTIFDFQISNSNSKVQAMVRLGSKLCWFCSLSWLIHVVELLSQIWAYETLCTSIQFPINVSSFWFYLISTF